MSKIATKLGIVSAEDMYKFYVKGLLKANPTYKAERFKCRTQGRVFDTTTGIEIITYDKFKKILTTHNKALGEKLINGYTFDLGNSLGDMFVARVERPLHGRRLNRGESFKLRKKLKEEGRLTADNWKVPYTDDDFIMIIWHKGNKKVQNIRLYKFKAAGGQPGKGFRQKLSSSVRINPSLQALYPYLPTKSLEPQNVTV